MIRRTHSRLLHSARPKSVKMPIAIAILFGVMIEDSCDCSIVSSIGVNVAGGEKPWVKSGKGGKSGDQSTLIAERS